MIKVTFTKPVETLRSAAELYQWDTGQSLEIGGLGDCGTPDIHFTFYGMKFAYVVKSESVVDKLYVEIPNKILTYGKDIIVYICTDVNGVKSTLASVVIPVIKRNMPADYFYNAEDDELATVDRLLAETERATEVETNHEQRISNIETNHGERITDLESYASKNTEQLRVIMTENERQHNELQSQNSSLTAEVAQARVNADGNERSTLKNRLDSDFNDLQNQIATTNTEIGGVKEDLTYQTDKIGLMTKRFSMGATSTHSSKIEQDKIYRQIHIGDTITISVKTDNVLGEDIKFVAYGFTPDLEDGTSIGSGLINGDEKKITLNAEYIAIGFYIPRLGVASNLLCAVEYADSVYTKINSITTDIENTSVTIERSNLGVQTFAGMGNFQHFGLKQDGTFLESQKYRVSTDEPISFSRSITVGVSSGFRWGYIPVEDGTVGSWSGWKTEPFTINADTEFLVQIARETEDTSEIADVLEFLNAVTFATKIYADVTKIGETVSAHSKMLNSLSTDEIVTEWEQGSIDQSGNISSDYRIRTKGFLPITDIIHFEVQTGYSAVCIQYGERKNFLGGTNWTPGIFDIEKIDSAAFYRVCLSKVTGADRVITVDEAENVSIKGSYRSITQEIEKIESVVFKNGTNMYTGEKIPSKIYSFDFSKIITMSYSGTDLTSQDMDIYGDYLFVALSKTSEMIKVFSLTNKSEVASIPVVIHHGSGMQFSNEFYQENDEFPLLYVGGWNNNLISAVRITRSDDTWIAEVVKTIYLPSEHGYYLSPSIDTDNNIMYAYGHKEDSMFPTEMTISKWDLNTLTLNSDGTYTPEFISKCMSRNIGTYQGHKYFGGRIYMAISNISSPHDSKFCAIDPNTGDILTVIDMTPVTSSESEGLCFKITDKEIKWYYSDYFNIFEIDFY